MDEFKEYLIKQYSLKKYKNRKFRYRLNFDFLYMEFNDIKIYPKTPQDIKYFDMLYTNENKLMDELCNILENSCTN
jgi:hypothetical protein